MKLEDRQAQGHPLASTRQVLRFLVVTLRGFIENGGFELAGAIAYNTLLSVVPLLLLVTITFARFVDQERFIRAVASEIRQLLPSVQARPVNEAIVSLLQEPFSGGLVGLATLLFFSTLAFRTLQHALDVIFRHRRDLHPPRPTIISVLISLAYVLGLGVVAFLQALALVRLEKFPAIAALVPQWAGPIGLVGAALLLASIYMVMPVGKGSRRAALIGGALAALLWQAVQNVMSWYFANVSKVNLIYGSLAGIVVVLFSFELAAASVLFAAQLIAEVEKNWNAGRHWYETPDNSPSSRAPNDSAQSRRRPAAGL